MPRAGLEPASRKAGDFKSPVYTVPPPRQGGFPRGFPRFGTSLLYLQTGSLQGAIVFNESFRFRDTVRSTGNGETGRYKAAAEHV